MQSTILNPENGLHRPSYFISPRNERFETDCRETTAIAPEIKAWAIAAFPPEKQDC